MHRLRDATLQEKFDMLRKRTLIAALSTATVGLAFALDASAASLQAVKDWATVTGLPADVTMSIYVPDKVATKPPVLALIHYCGGTADAVFGQARQGGLVSAADKYGFIMVVPSSGRCWDVQSNKTWKRDGLGDSQAIREMVRYAIEKRGGNAERVYATGDSSGGMMTELLLALYPDVFKAGAAFAGMPAACRGGNENGNGGGYSGACADGKVSHTAEEWGKIARDLFPGYTGHRPRVQLFHGDSDRTIRYPNHTEAIKEWSNLLALGATPTSTQMGVQLGTHQAKRETWNNDCGYPVLDAFTSIGGDHGPSDALFKAEYVVPFLGLDQTAAVDPEIEECAGGGAPGSGGSGGVGAGGSAAAGTSSGGTSNGGGGVAGGGIAGASATGGGGASGASATGGNGGLSGAGGGIAGAASGGSPAATGGAPVGSGGLATSGGAASGGSSASSGGSHDGAGGGPSSQSMGGSAPGNGGAVDDSGCNCRVGQSSSGRAQPALALAGLALLTLARRRRHATRRS